MPSARERFSMTACCCSARRSLGMWQPARRTKSDSVSAGRPWHLGTAGVSTAGVSTAAAGVGIYASNVIVVVRLLQERNRDGADSGRRQTPQARPRAVVELAPRSYDVVDVG